jgi:RNA polymerase sigma factor (sigma-70 family)
MNRPRLPALATATLTGEPALALEAVYNEHYGFLFYWVLGQVKNKEIAEDICGRTFSQALKHWDQLRDPAKARSWLFAIAYNEARRHWLRPAADPLEDHLERPDPRDFIEELEKWVDVRRGLAMLRLLNPLHRRALLCHIRGLSVEDSARRCRTSVNTFGSRLHKAKKLLQAMCA